MLSIVFLYILAICLPTFIIIIILNVVESKILACYKTLSQCQHLESWGRMFLSSWPGCAIQTNSALNIKINRNHYKFTKKIQFSLTGDKLGTKPWQQVDNEGNK